MEIFSYFIIFFYLFSKGKTKEEKDIFEVNKNLKFCGADYMKHEIKFSPISKTLKSNLTR